MNPLGWLRSEQLDYGVFLAVFGVVFMLLGLHWVGVTQSNVFGWLFALSPIWLPIITFAIFFYKYMSMVGELFYVDVGRVTYEVRLPQEVYKSPEAMESALSLLFNKATPDNLMETYLQGKRPQIFSFEIVSNGGELKFYINLPIKKASLMLESAFYSQYPGIELRKLDLDYTAEIPHDHPDHFLMSFHMCKSKNQAYPIKTYIDAKLDTLPKEEEKVDPLTTIVEFMSSIKPTEKIWVQYLMLAHRERSFKNGQLRSAPTWEKGVSKEIETVMQRDGSPTDFEGMPRLTPGERQTVEAMERNVEKPAFEMACRWIYFVDINKDKPNGDNFAGMLRSFAAFDVAGRNKLGITWRTDFNYKFLSDPFGSRLATYRKMELKEYKLRKLFPKDQNSAFKVFSTEELATLWHPLGSVALTPTLDRVSSQKATAPPNLPTG